MSEPASEAVPDSTDGTRGGRIGRALLAVAFLAVLPAFLRLWPIEHGAPRPEFVPDTHVVRNALGMASTKNPVPQANEFSSYPYLLPYVLLPVFAADYVVGKSEGLWAGSGEYGNHLKENPWRAHRLARIVLALIAATAPLFVFLTARAAGMRTGAWVAAWLAATSLLHIQLSLQERPWAPMTAAIAATAWAAAVHVRTGTLRSLLWAGVLAAVAGSMHQAGLLVLGIVGVAWALAPERGANGDLPGRPFDPACLKRRVRWGFSCVALFAVVALVIGHPYVLVHGFTDSSQVAAQGDVRDGQTQLTLGAQQVVLGIRAATFTGLSKSFFGYDPVLLVLGLGGLVLAFRRRMLIPAMVFLLGWGAFFMTNVNEHIRYLLPMAMLLTLPAGLAVERMAVQRASRLTLVALLAIPLVQALRLGAVLRQPDTRSIAAELLTELPPDAVVAIDVYGAVVPRTREMLELTRSLRDLYGRENHRLMMLEADQPQAPGIRAFRAEDVFEYDLRHGGTWIRTDLAGRLEGKVELGTTPGSALRALGATHWLSVDRSPDDGVLPPLLDPTPSRPHGDDGPYGEPVPKLELLNLPGPPIWTVHPAWREPRKPDEREAPDARLPTALSFPLRDLWAVERPGPKLELFAL